MTIKGGDILGVQKPSKKSSDYFRGLLSEPTANRFCWCAWLIWCLCQYWHFLVHDCNFPTKTKPAIEHYTGCTNCWQVFSMQPHLLTFFYWKTHNCDDRMCSSSETKKTWGLSVMFYGKFITSVLSHQSCAPPHCWSYEPTEPLGLYCTLRLCLLGKQTKHHTSLLTKGRKILCNTTELHKSWIQNRSTTQRWYALKEKRKKSLFKNEI